MIFLLLLFLIGIIIAYWFGNKLGAFRRDKYWEEQLPLHRKQAILKSRAILGGSFSEQLAPFLPDFNYIPTECRFIGKPIDLIVFKGLDKKQVEEIVFVEVKSGDSKLSPVERKLKEAVEKKKVKWEEYRVPKELTKKKNID